MNLLQLIGNTPLLDLEGFIADKPGVRLHAKAEWMNPGGSIKDRPVKAMLSEAIATGHLTKDMTIIDSSSGNAGIAYSMIGRALGFEVKIVIPGNASLERKQRILAHGAQILETDALEGYDEALREVRRQVESKPGKYFFSDQYGNENNWKAHYHGTGVELIQQVEQRITHFICGVGTGGSITGIGRRLKETYPDVNIIGVRPEVWPGIEGLKPLGDPEDIIPDIFDESVVTEWVDVTADEAKSWCKKLAEQGIFVGQSSGAYMAVCMKVIHSLDQGIVTTLFSDLGERYFSAGLWR